MWDRFDICEAWNLYAHDFGAYGIKAGLDRMAFRCSPMRETYDTIDENAQRIYDELAQRYPNPDPWTERLEPDND